MATIRRRSFWPLFFVLLPLTKGETVDPVAKLPNVDKPVPVINVAAVIGGKAELPCDIDPSDPSDDVYLVLWYRHEAGKPLYSFDVRGRNSEEGKHWSAKEPFGSRAFFRVGTDPTYLLINDVRLEDEDIYRCRVDYRNSPTRNIKLNLTVVVPPNSPRIISEDKRIETSKAIAGVYHEDEVMRLKCDVVGGRPLPAVTWWINGSLVDDSYNTEERGTVVNKLQDMKAERHLDGAKIECRASNNNVSSPQSRILEISINLRPKSVSILQKPEFVRADEEYELVCQAFGSKPPAVITWYNGHLAMDKAAITTRVHENPSVTNSHLTYTPRQTDNGVRITCRADNPGVIGSAIEDSIILAVMYPPAIQLRLGPSLQSDGIKEGDDVYFECSVRSNPPIKRLEWLHNSVPLHHNVTQGVILSNQSLVIQRINRSHAGHFSCSAENAHGAGKSNDVQLKVKYRPVCSSSESRSEYGVVMGGNVTVSCGVSANPPVSKFRWWFNSAAGKAVEVLADEFSSTGSVSSVTYSPKSEMEYGTLSCLGINEIGSQAQPCTFAIKPASRPQPPENCLLRNKTSDTYEVNCKTSYSGGLRQVFVLEIYDTKTRSLRRNETNLQAPYFLLQNLRGLHPLQFELYAVNSRGVSEKVIITDIRVNKPEKHTNTVSLPSNLSTDSMILVTCGLGIALLLILAFALVFMHRRKGLSKKLLDCRSNFAISDNATPHETTSIARGSEVEPQVSNRKAIITSTITPKNFPSSPPFRPPVNDVTLQKRVISTATMAQTKPILKTTSSAASNDGGGERPTPPYSRRHETANWYQNPMDQDAAAAAAVWIARQHGQYHRPPPQPQPHHHPSGPESQNQFRTLGRIGLPESAVLSSFAPSPSYCSLPRRSLVGHPAPAEQGRKLRYNNSVRDLETDAEYLLNTAEQRCNSDAAADIKV